MHRGVRRQTGEVGLLPSQELGSPGAPLLLASGVPGQKNESCALPIPEPLTKWPPQAPSWQGPHQQAPQQLWALMGSHRTGEGQGGQ